MAVPRTALIVIDMLNTYEHEDADRLVVVPPDANAHIFEDLAKAALKMMERNMHATVVAAAEAYSRSS